MYEICEKGKPEYFCKCCQAIVCRECWDSWELRCVDCTEVIDEMPN